MLMKKYYTKKQNKCKYNRMINGCSVLIGFIYYSYYDKIL
jgi:hypothetical protein